MGHRDKSTNCEAEVDLSFSLELQRGRSLLLCLTEEASWCGRGRLAAVSAITASDQRRNQKLIAQRSGDLRVFAGVVVEGDVVFTSQPQLMPITRNGVSTVHIHNNNNTGPEYSYNPFRNRALGRNPIDQQRSVCSIAGKQGGEVWTVEGASTSTWPWGYVATWWWSVVTARCFIGEPNPSAPHYF
ncbi:unnamed protein product [Boreogadus saida]